MRLKTQLGFACLGGNLQDGTMFDGIYLLKRKKEGLAERWWTFELFLWSSCFIGIAEWSAVCFALE